MQDTFPVLSPVKLALVGEACCQTQCACCLAGAAVGLACVIIFPFLRGQSHFGMVLVSIWTACTWPGLWPCFGWALAKGILEGMSPQVNSGIGQVVPARSALSLLGNGARSHLEKLFPKLGLRQCVCRRTQRQAMTISKLTGVCSC